MKFFALIFLASVLALPVATALAQDADVTLDCLVEPARTVDVAGNATGLLSEVLVGRGDHVKKGQVIAKLDATVENANVMVAKAQAEGDEDIQSAQTRLDLATANLTRNQQLQKSGSVTKSQVEELQAAVQIAQSELDSETRKQNLARIELQRQEALLGLQDITSPIDGVVVQQKLDAGEFMRQESAVLTVVQTDPLYIEAYVPMDLWGKVTTNSTGTVVLEQPIGTKLPAKVTVVDPVFDAASGTFGVRLELPNPEQSIPAGQRCQVVLSAPEL